MPRLSLQRTDDFTGGLNLRADPFQLDKNESPDMLNVDIDPRGGFSIRPGMSRVNTSAIGSVGSGAFTPKRLFNWSGSSPQLLAAANGKVFFSTAGSTWTDTSITYSSSGGATFAEWSTSSTAVVYVASGTGTSQMSKWNGSARTLLTASATGQWQDSFASPTGTHMPRCDLTVNHMDMLWVASTFENSTAFPNRIRFSHPLFPESWREADYIDIVGGGNGITALMSWGEALIVFKTNSVWAIYGYDPDTFQVQQITGDYGAPHQGCVVGTEYGLFFFDWPNGMYAWDGRKITDLFSKLRPLIQDNEVSSTGVPNISLSHCQNKLWLSLPLQSDTTPTATYVFDPSIGAWTKYQLADGRGITHLLDFVTSANSRLYVGLHPTQPYLMNVRASGAWQDNVTGTAADYQSFYVTRWQDGGVISAKKMWRQPDFVVKQPDVDLNLTVEVYHNWEEAAPKRTLTMTVPAPGGPLVWSASATEPDGIDGWGEANWGGGAEGSQFQRGSRLGSARSVQLKIIGPGGSDWGVNSITYKYNSRRIR